MSKKNDYSKVFGKGKSSYDIKVKKNKSSNHDIFFNDVKKKKKKKKKQNIDKEVRKVINGFSDESILSEFLIWEKVTDIDIPNLKELSDVARGLFVIKLNLNGVEQVLVPIMITSEGEILHTETGDSLVLSVASYITGSKELTDIDIQTARDGLYNVNAIEAVYNINTTKLMEQMRLFSSENIVDEED